MKRIILFSILICFMTSSITGCVKRVSVKTIEKQRIDQNTSSGNQGYLLGEKPPVEETKEKQTTRKIYQVTFEVPPYAEWKNFRNEKTVDKELWGNRGYIYGGPQAISTSYEDEKEQESDEKEIVLPDEGYEEDEEAVSERTIVQDYEDEEEDEEQVKFITYKVKKGDTLQKISKKVYGTTKKWQKIYNFNKGTLKNPNKIYPGQKILIPQE